MTPSTAAASRPGTTGVAGLHHVAVVSRDLARSADFYGRILGLADVGLGPVPVAPMERPGRLEEATGLSIVADGFPAEMVDDEPEARGAEVVPAGR